MSRHHEQRMGVYFDDLDAFGILHNARYLLLFERTLGGFWRALDIGSGTPGSGKRHTHLVASNHIDYHRPVRGVGELRVRIHVQQLGTSSLTFAFRMMPIDEDVEYATGQRVVVCVDPETYKPRPWSAELRDAMAPYARA